MDGVWVCISVSRDADADDDDESECVQQRSEAMSKPCSGYGLDVEETQQKLDKWQLKRQWLEKDKQQSRRV